MLITTVLIIHCLCVHVCVCVRRYVTELLVERPMSPVLWYYLLSATCVSRWKPVMRTLHMWWNSRQVQGGPSIPSRTAQQCMAPDCYSFGSSFQRLEMPAQDRQGKGVDHTWRDAATRITQKVFTDTWWWAPRKKISLLQMGSDSESEDEEVQPAIQRYRAEPTIKLEDCPLRWVGISFRSPWEAGLTSSQYLATPATTVPCERLSQLQVTLWTRKGQLYFQKMWTS